MIRKAGTGGKKIRRTTRTHAPQPAVLSSRPREHVRDQTQTWAHITEADGPTMTGAHGAPPPLRYVDRQPIWLAPSASLPAAGIQAGRSADMKTSQCVDNFVDYC